MNKLIGKALVRKLGFIFILTPLLVQGQVGERHVQKISRYIEKFNSYSKVIHDSMFVDGGYENVWNGKFVGLGEIKEIDGVDIDTFNVSSPIINEGDTSAKVVLGTAIDSWNLVYIILSFRSDVLDTGVGLNTVGNITYTIN